MQPECECVWLLQKEVVMYFNTHTSDLGFEVSHSVTTASILKVQFIHMRKSNIQYTQNIIRKMMF